MSDINQVLWGRSIDLLTATSVFSDGDGVSIDNRVINVVFELLQQLQQARREGWEQAKKEALKIADNGPSPVTATNIAAMLYKEKS